MATFNAISSLQSLSMDLSVGGAASLLRSLILGPFKIIASLEKVGNPYGVGIGFKELSRNLH